MDFSRLIKEGTQRVYEQDLESQKNFIESICHKIRGMDEEIIFKANGFFVPNDDYLKLYFDPVVTSQNFDLYDTYGNCQWSNRLILPIENAVGDVSGLVGFDPFRYLEAHETGDWSLNYYYYSTKKVFNKGVYFYCIPGTYKKALDDNYVIITDGVFDTLSFAAAGYNSMAALGSTVTQEMVAQLRFINLILVAVDNDDAGIHFYEQFKKKLSNVIFVAQGSFKDADDVLKSDYSQDYKKMIDKCISSVMPHDISLKKKNRFNNF